MRHLLHSKEDYISKIHAPEILKMRPMSYVSVGQATLTQARTPCWNQHQFQKTYTEHPHLWSHYWVGDMLLMDNFNNAPTLDQKPKSMKAECSLNTKTLQELLKTGN